MASCMAQAQAEGLAAEGVTNTAGHLQPYWSRFGATVDAVLSGSWLQTVAQKESTSLSAAPATPQKLPDAKPGTEHAPPVVSTDEPVEFDSVFLGGSQKLDLSKFARADYVQPGLLHVELRVNSVRSMSDVVRFEATSDGSGQPCLSARQITQLGILVAFTPEATRCYRVESLVPGARYTFDSGEQVLDLIIAQAYVRASHQKLVDPSLWDKGIPVLHTQYSLSANDNWNEAKRSRYYFGRFDNTLSAQGWQLKNSLVLNQTPQGRQSQSLHTYARTDLPEIKGEFRIGNFYTSGVLFDTLNLSGVSLTSYDEFLPENELGYAPVIRGTAETNATVTVIQNGLEIYKTTVPAGPFVISDLRGAGYSGTLQVTITEASGLQKTFLAPYSSQVQMVRQGRLKYGINAGHINTPGLAYKPEVSQLTAQYGLFSSVTVYGGVTASAKYTSRLLGLALSSFAGTLAYDQTYSNTRFDNNSTEGRRSRISYSKTVESSQTYINISKTAHQQGEYLSINEAMLQLNQVSSNSVSTLSQWLATVAQPLGAFGDISLSLVRSRYSGGAPDNDSYTLGWRKSLAGMSLTVSATRQWITPPGQSAVDARGYAIQVNIPLQKIMGTMGAAITSNAGTLSQQAYYNQSFGQDRQLNLNMAAGKVQGQGSSSTGTLAYQSHLGTHSLGLSVGQQYKSLSYGTTGGVALHAGGLTWGSMVSDTMAIVHAPGAQGALVNASAGARVDSNGYAIIANLQPYRVNQVYLDPRGMAMDTELNATSQQTVIRSGAVAQLNFSTVTGRGLMLTLQRPAHMEEVPFGATVSNAQGREIGVVGQGGRVFMREIGDDAHLLVHWGSASHESCSVRIQRPTANPNTPYDSLRAECR